MRYVTLSPVPELETYRQPELVALALDGRAARSTIAGYETRTLTPEELADIRAALSHQGEWADAHLLSGAAPEPRWRLTLGRDSSRREITADLPLANAALPEALYRMFVSLERLRFGDAAWDALEPSVVRVWLVLNPDATGDAAAMPRWLDHVAASSRDGQRVVVAELSGAERAWFSEIRPRLVALSNGRPATLSWSVDWATWAESDD